MMIGHNNGPTMDAGGAWRTHCWGAARKALLPHLPIEVLRGRLKRAGELGLDYRTYAGIRATTGRDIVAVLFSSNALELRKGQLEFAAKKIEKLMQTEAWRQGLATQPLQPCDMLRAAPLDGASAAPAAFAPFRVQRLALQQALSGFASDETILVGAYGAEAEWCATARLAGYVPTQVFFAE
ncbi:hypothetical protein [Pseudorhodobacter ferrugineus]|uniref:hypothetical protein n=1 Tax=Pseudorhodobacter ferrugineus TaxID=77008 RepID=UPI00067CC577|nr:hypothetical protein [Pseudorhodobacter ferrugineus]